MAEIVIRTVNLKKSYKKGVFAVNGLDLSIEKGKITGFLGPNGAGKSTTIKMMLGLLEPTEGRVEIMGKKVNFNTPRIRKNIGFMPELPKFPKYLTGSELLKTYGEMSQISKEILTKQIPELLDEVGLKNDVDKKIGNYSKGMQQRLGLAVAFLGSPELAIMDEPTVGLDPVGMVDVKQLIEQKAKNGTTVFLSSHLLKEVEELCDEVIVINKGKLVTYGTVDKVISEAYKKTVLEIEVDKIAAIGDKLRSLPFVSNITVIGNKIMVELSTTEDVRAQISKLVTDSGVIILNISYVRETLESAFIELLKKGGS